VAIEDLRKAVLRLIAESGALNWSAHLLDP
jgi:hypothetical protein